MAMKAKVSFEIESPCDCTQEQLIEWIQYNLGYINEVSIEPLGDYVFEVERRPLIRIVETEAGNTKNNSQ